MKKKTAKHTVKKPAPIKSVHKTPFYTHKYFWPVLISFVTFIAYIPTFNNGFMELWDDASYVTQNKLILSLNLKDIFTTFYGGNYHPLTALSNAIEYQLFGLNPVFFHLNNLLLHICNALLVFHLVQLLFKKIEVSVITSLFFGIHPMHVESVAWVAERKDVLYTLFFLLSLIYYYRHVTQTVSSRKNYFIALLFFVCSCMSKPAAIILPAVLVLTDWLLNIEMKRKVIFEKIPFFLLALLFGIVMMLSQEEGLDAGETLKGDFSFFDSIFLCSHTVMRYIYKAFVPINMTTMYRFPEKIGNSLPQEFYLSVLFIIFLIAVILLTIRKTKVITYSIMFFFITIFLVLQIVPVGSFIMAERYTYVPYIGIFIIVGHLYSLLKKLPAPLTWIWKLVVMITFLWALAFMYGTWQRVKLWEHAGLLFSDTGKKSHAYMGYNKAAFYYYKNNMFEESLDNYNKAMEIYPDKAGLHKMRGAVYFSLNKYNEAISDMSVSISLDSSDAECYYTRAVSYSSLGNFPAAIPDYNKFFLMNDSVTTADPYLYRATALLITNDFDNTIKDLLMYFSIDSTAPKKPEAYMRLGYAYLMKGIPAAAAANLSKSIEMSPGNPNTHYWRGLTYNTMEKYDLAANDFTLAITYNPAYIAAYENRAIAYRGMNKPEFADADMRKAQELKRN